MRNVNSDGREFTLSSHNDDSVVFRIARSETDVYRSAAWNARLVRAREAHLSIKKSF